MGPWGHGVKFKWTIPARQPAALQHCKNGNMVLPNVQRQANGATGATAGAPHGSGLDIHHLHASGIWSGESGSAGVDSRIDMPADCQCPISCLRRRPLRPGLCQDGAGTIPAPAARGRRRARSRLRDTDRDMLHPAPAIRPQICPSPTALHRAFIMRVFSASLATDTNTFAPQPPSIASFKARSYFPPGQHPQQLTLFSGPLCAAREVAAAKGWTLIEGMVASAQPGGTVTRAAYEGLRAELLRDLQAALPLDMVLLGLHGAMVAEGYDDCEGDLLERVRALVGAKTVVGAELDPHMHLTPAMVRHADLLVSMKEYPHTDVMPRARELVALCGACVSGRIRPKAALVDCRMVVPMHTTRPPARGFIDKVIALEGCDGVLSISIGQGFAHGDVPEMGCKVLVYTDGDAAKAQSLARELAEEMIAMREQLAVRRPPVDEALDEALLACGRGPVGLADPADNPGSGALGASPFIARRLIERGIRNVAIGPIWDPVAARIRFDAGAGAQLALRIGGKIGPLSGPPPGPPCPGRAPQAAPGVVGRARPPTWAIARWWRPKAWRSCCARYATRRSTPTCSRNSVACSAARRWWSSNRPSIFMLRSPKSPPR